MAEPKIAILASGSGSTAEAFIQAGVDGKIEARVSLVIASRPDAGIIERIARLNDTYGLNIEVAVIGKHNYPNPEDEEKALLNMLSSQEFDAIALMGYMKRIGPNLIKKFGWVSEYTSPYQAKMINTHPGLLPDSKGLYGIHVQEDAIKKGAKYSGQTLHVVSENYDEGPTVAEHRVKILPDDTPENLFARVQETEKLHLPEDIDNYIKARRKYLEEQK